jgi:hypothetical protein
MDIVLDAPGEKLARWVTPRLTSVSFGGDAAGGGVNGATEGRHITAPTVHYTSSTDYTSLATSSSVTLANGNAAASS